MFKFKLVLEDGTPVDPATFVAAVLRGSRVTRSRWFPGRCLRVVEVREGVLVVASAA